jgi:hypothetical protein
MRSNDDAGTESQVITQVDTARQRVSENRICLLTLLSERDLDLGSFVFGEDKGREDGRDAAECHRLPLSVERLDHPGDVIVGRGV